MGTVRISKDKLDMGGGNIENVGDLKAATGRAATYVVAASDAPAHVKDQADFVCDGTDDQVEIQAAIDALPTHGGTVHLSAGRFNFSAGVVSTREFVKVTGEGGQPWVQVSQSVPRGTTIMASGAIIAFEWGNTDLYNRGGPHFENIGIVGTADCIGGFKINTMDKPTFRDVTVSNFTNGYGLFLDASGTGNIIGTLLDGFSTTFCKFGVTGESAGALTMIGGLILGTTGFGGGKISGGIGFATGNTPTIINTAFDGWETAIKLNGTHALIKARLEGNTTAIHLTSDAGRNVISGCQFVNNTTNVLIDDPAAGTSSSRGSNLIMGNGYTPVSTRRITDNTTGNFAQTIFEPTTGFQVQELTAVANAVTYHIRQRNAHSSVGADAKYTIETTSSTLGGIAVLGTVRAGAAYTGVENENDFELRRNGTAIAKLSANGFEVLASGLIAASLPTSDPAVAGAIWNDAGTLKVSSG